jgi:hypothetical protein
MSAVRLPRLSYCYTAFLAVVGVQFGQGTAIRNFPQTSSEWRCVERPAAPRVLSRGNTGCYVRPDHAIDEVRALNLVPLKTSRRRSTVQRSLRSRSTVLVNGNSRSLWLFNRRGTQGGETR